MFRGVEILSQLLSVFDKLIWRTIGPKCFLFGTTQLSLWTSGAVNSNYIVTNSINSLLIGSRCILNGAQTYHFWANLAHAPKLIKSSATAKHLDLFFITCPPPYITISIIIVQFQTSLDLLDNVVHDCHWLAVSTIYTTMYMYTVHMYMYVLHVQYGITCTCTVWYYMYSMVMHTFKPSSFLDINFDTKDSNFSDWKINKMSY